MITDARIEAVFGRESKGKTFQRRLKIEMAARIIEKLESNAVHDYHDRQVLIDGADRLLDCHAMTRRQTNTWEKYCVSDENKFTDSDLFYYD